MHTYMYSLLSSPKFLSLSTQMLIKSLPLKLQQQENPGPSNWQIGILTWTPCNKPQLYPNVHMVTALLWGESLSLQHSQAPRTNDTVIAVVYSINHDNAQITPDAPMPYYRERTSFPGSWSCRKMCTLNNGFMSKTVQSFGASENRWMKRRELHGWISSGEREGKKWQEQEEMWANIEGICI